MGHVRAPAQINELPLLVNRDCFVPEIPDQFNLVVLPKLLKKLQRLFLVSVLDIGPTILDLIGLNCPDSFHGESLFSENFGSREYVQCEHLGRGPCDFETKAINICLRTRSRKLVFQSPAGNIDGGGEIREIYDLLSDPNEFNNLANSHVLIKEDSDLLIIAKARCKKIRADLKVESIGPSVPA